jgi:glycosyltransferase
MINDNKIALSIITATKNCVGTLPDCLTSILHQDYKNYEHIIIDGASTDGTIDVLSQHLDHISVFKSESDKGIYDALNKGIKLSTGDVIGFLHSDDFYASTDVLTRIARAFEDQSVCAIYGDLEYVNKEDKSKTIRRWRSKKFSKKDLYWGWMPPHPTLYVRRDWFLRNGNFDTSYRISADYLCILKLFLHKDFKAIYLPHVLVKMRLGGLSNKSLISIIKKSSEDWRALRSCNFSLTHALFAITCKNLSKLGQFI